MIRAFLLLIAFVFTSSAATRYIDKNATGAANGTSWSDAWTNLSQASGLTGGDVCYISGGTTGNTNIYPVSNTTFKAGNADGNRVTYRIGQDTGHKEGFVRFTSPNGFVDQAYIVLDGDSGDGLRHFQMESNHLGNPFNNNTGYIRFSYINFGDTTKGFTSNGGTKIQINNCYMRKVNGGDDFIGFLNLVGESYGISQIFSNEFHIVRDASGGLGDDGFQSSLNGADIFHNTFTGFTGTYTGSQHQDGLQPLTGQFTRIFNNYFENLANYAIFYDSYFGGFSNIFIYQNIAVITSSAIQASDPPSAFVVVPDGVVFAQLGYWPLFTNIFVANNLTVDYGVHRAVFVNNQNGSQFSVFTNCIAVNNASVNSGGNDIASTIFTNGNVNLTKAQGTNNFVLYRELTAGGDFHLAEGASLLLDLGTNLTTYFTNDFDGVARPASTAWDIGAYESGAEEPPLRRITATTLRVGTISSP
jgi:hypothetical protein